MGRAIERLRRSRGYVATFRFLTQRALPFVFLLAVFHGAGAVLAQSIFAVRSSWGSICRPTIKPAEVEARRPVKERVPTDALCAATGLELKEAGTYRLTLAIPRDEPWLDAELGARAYGIDPHALGTGRLLVWVPFRRHLGQPWFKPMMRIGWRGDDAYPLDPKPSLSKEHLDRASEAGPAGCDAGQDNGEPTIAFASEVVAPSSGELFIYVNDAIFLPPWTDLFYRNNRGSACLTVEKIVPAP